MTRQVIPSRAGVVMDNASFHQRHDVLDAIGAQQCIAAFLPSTSPTLIRSNTNGLQLKPSEGNTAAVLMSSLPSIHNMSFIMI